MQVDTVIRRHCGTFSVVGSLISLWRKRDLMKSLKFSQSQAEFMSVHLKNLLSMSDRSRLEDLVTHVVFLLHYASTYATFGKISFGNVHVPSCTFESLIRNHASQHQCWQ